jgi:hypothetical protein
VVAELFAILLIFIKLKLQNISETTAATWRQKLAADFPLNGQQCGMALFNFQGSAVIRKIGLGCKEKFNFVICLIFFCLTFDKFSVRFDKEITIVNYACRANVTS